tara:strand:+ start:200 stop:874 length:675 start_codon:yes stop_codon:yes gene_type:complete
MKDLAKKYNLTKDDYWQESRSGKWIVTHNACQKIAHKEGVTYAPPQIINSEKDLVRMVVTGKKDDVVIWKTGEADTKNCKNLYLFAMAEKRAKDRVCLSLINAYGYIYSDVEADDFKKPAEEFYTEEQTAEFAKLIENECFKGKKNTYKDKLRKSNTKTHYQSVLDEMELYIEFDEILGHPAFDDLQKFSNDEWKKCVNLQDYRNLLVRMRGEKNKYDSITGVK